MKATVLAAGKKTDNVRIT